MTDPRPEKIAPGRYKYRGRYIIRTDWEGPRGGTKYLWELGSEDKYHGIVLDSVHFWPTMREVVAWLDRPWAIIACDDDGVTVDKTGPDPEFLVNHVASWAQQEADRWPEHGLIYMLISPEELTRLPSDETPAEQ